MSGENITQKDKQPLNFVLIGRSGCGKGTQVKLLMEKFGNLVVISTGDLFRDLAKQDTATGKIINQTISTGGLPYDEMATTLWMHAIAYRIKENEGIVADGMPRRLSEAKAYDRFMEYLGRDKSIYYLLIDISREEAFNRLTKRRICKNCGRIIPWVGEFKKLVVCDKCQGELANRPDDTSEAIKNRLDYYDDRVSEVVEYYRDNGKLITINGEQPIEKVFEDILKAIEENKL